MNGVKQYTTCQRTSYHNTNNHNRYLPTVWTVWVTGYTHFKLASIKILENFLLTIVFSLKSFKIFQLKKRGGDNHVENGQKNCWFTLKQVFEASWKDYIENPFLTKCLFCPVSEASWKQLWCQYYRMDAPHRRWLNAERKNSTLIAQECYELLWTNPENNTPRNNSCTATYFPSQKHPSKTNGTLLEKQGRTHKWRSSIDPFTWSCQCWPIWKNLPKTALHGHRM